jgi:hypothetical protein
MGSMEPVWGGPDEWAQQVQSGTVEAQQVQSGATLTLTADADIAIKRANFLRFGCVTQFQPRSSSTPTSSSTPSSSGSSSSSSNTPRA